MRHLIPLAVLSLVACRDPSPTSTSVVASASSSASSAAAPDGGARAELAALDGTISEARRAAEVLGRADAATKAEASTVLAQSIAFTASDAWRRKNEAVVVEANKNTGIDATTPQLEGQLRAFQDEELARRVALAPAIGGPPLVAACLEVASGPFAKARTAARAALDAMKGSLGPEDAARVAALSAEPARGAKRLGNLAIEDVRSSGGAVANAGAVLAAMSPGFRRCYNRALAADASVGEGKVALKVRIGPAGEVTGALPIASGPLGTAPSCIAARASSAQFAPPTGGPATLEFVVKLKPN